MVVDSQSGQVYEETEMGPPVGFVNGFAWEHESPFLDADYELRSDLGVPALKHLAMKKTLSDQRSLNQSLFLDVPWPIAAQLWEYLSRSGKRTMYMWKILCTTYPGQFRHVSQHCRMVIDKPRIPMRGYISLVKSTDCSWATQLNIWTEFAWTPELVELADVVNLVSLEINTASSRHSYLGDGQSQEVVSLDERVLRAWTELIETSGSFQYLRTLKLHGQRNITGNAFYYLSKFPSLEYCVVAKCDGLTTKSAIKTAEAHGWFLSQDKLEGTAYQFSQDTSIGLNTSTSWSSKRPDSLLPSTMSGDIPLLEFTVGHRRAKSMTGLDIAIFSRKDNGHVMETQANKRKREGHTSLTERRAHHKTRRPAVKERGKDLSGLLGEFM